MSWKLSGCGFAGALDMAGPLADGDRKSTRLNSSHRCISYAVFCLKKKNTTKVLGGHLRLTGWATAPAPLDPSIRRSIFAGIALWRTKSHTVKTCGHGQCVPLYETR